MPNLPADNLNNFADHILTERYWNILEDSMAYYKPLASEIVVSLRDYLNADEVYLVDGAGDYIVDEAGNYIITIVERLLDSISVNKAPIDRAFTDATWPAFTESITVDRQTIFTPITIPLAADNAANYGDQRLLAMTGARRITFADDLNQWQETIGREQGTPGSGDYDHWITEDLIGPKNGSNQNFSVSNAPVVETMSVYMNGVRQVRVAVTPTPGEAQYGVSGTSVVLGQPPAAVGQWVVCRYFYDF